jgi:NAD+ synthase (glutamine-hydrolysing)
VGLTICEDVWAPGPPAQSEADAGAQLIANPSGSPYHRGKGREREAMFAERSRAYGTHFAFCNLVGGQDELIFDGQSLVTAPDGTLIARAAQFEEELLICEIPQAASGRLTERLGDLDEVYGALTLGLRDYVAKNGFQHVGVALSGGIDSALVAMLAADAVGAERLTCVVMPSPHSSDETQQDAREIAANLGCELIEIEIEPMMHGYELALDGLLAPGERPREGEEAPPRDPARPSEPDLAAENIQARIRGNLMMALSNRHGWLVLTTGNKSEMSVGYATLYGDMAGGFAVIKDVPKGLVYELVRRRNERAGSDLVPASVLDRAPSAELRPDQRDEDSLPPYELLDRILEAYVERDEGREEMIAAGMPAETVDDVLRLVDRSEYKRRQAAPGIRITPKAFGKDRRLPITNRYGG